MNAMTPHRGAAPVGYLEELGPVEAGAVRYLRMWCEGPDAQAQVWSDFASALGVKTGRDALKSFECLCDYCVRHGRRPLMRHQVNCKCLGGDESCFANFVGYATDGDREDALFIATTIIRPDMAPMAVECARQFGLALQQMARTPQTPQHFTRGSTTLH